MQDLQNQINELTARMDALSSADTIPYENFKAISSRFPKFLFGEATIDFPSTAAGASTLKTIGVSGAIPGDTVVLGLSSNASSAGILFDAYVSSQDIVTVEFQNQTSGAQDLDPALHFKVVVIQK